MEKLLLLLPLLLLLGCDSGSEDAPVTYGQTKDAPVNKSDTCLVNITTMPGNHYLDFTTGEQVFLRAIDQADWQLEVYNLSDCSMKAAYQLPENFSPDYPYFLADINYNTSQRMVGIRGYNRIHVIDLLRQKQSDPITPSFKQERIADATSGSIQHLEVWEDYLVGMTQDWGAFVFQLDSSGVNAVLPVAELQTEAGDYRCLFLIEDEQNAYQAILPSLSMDSGDFSVNALFDTPQPLQPKATVYAAGSPYVRLQDESGELIGVNLYTGELLPVIEEVKN